jgi:hypothetical protein
MIDSSLIHLDKIRAYQTTDYQFGLGESEIVLNIGKHSSQLALLFGHHLVNCGAFITAFNPQGTIQSDHANQHAHIELLHHLQALGLQCIEGAGSAASSDWPAERSYFALGLELEPAKKIGHNFNQDAIVWVGADVIPRLILLR